MKNSVKATAYNADMLEAIFTMNNWGETEIVCPDGTPVLVSPCYYGETATSRNDIEYYLVYADVPWMGANTIEKLANQLNKHGEYLAELTADRIEIRKFFDEHEQKGWDSDSWSFYSDWHKDLYGYRPHGHVCGVYVEPFKGACISNDYSEYTKVNAILCD